MGVYQITNFDWCVVGEHVSAFDGHDVGRWDCCGSSLLDVCWMYVCWLSAGCPLAVAAGWLVDIGQQ